MEAWNLVSRSAETDSCHGRATRQGSYGKRRTLRALARSNQDHDPRRSGRRPETGDRTSKLVMRFRLPSPALHHFCSKLFIDINSVR
jgi:hypothetical protein